MVHLYNILEMTKLHGEEISDSRGLRIERRQWGIWE